MKEKKVEYILVNVHVVLGHIEMVSVQIFEDKEKAISTAKSNADSDFYIGGDRIKSSYYEYSEKDQLNICYVLNERNQLYANKIDRPHVNSYTWRLVFEKEVK